MATARSRCFLLAQATKSRRRLEQCQIQTTVSGPELRLSSTAPIFRGGALSRIRAVDLQSGCYRKKYSLSWLSLRIQPHPFLLKEYTPVRKGKTPCTSLYVPQVVPCPTCTHLFEKLIMLQRASGVHTEPYQYDFLHLLAFSWSSYRARVISI